MDVLERIQNATENIARVMDVHGNIEVGGPNPAGEDEPYYSLAIADTYLREAEAELEEEGIEQGNEDGSNRDVPPFDNDPRTDDEIKQAVYDEEEAPHFSGS